MLTKLTLKQRKFWKSYSTHHNLSRAAKDAGSKGKDVKSLSTIGKQILDSLEVSMPELLNSHDLGTSRLAEIIDNQLKAKRPIYATWKGKIEDVRLFPDNAAIGKAAELLGRMHGAFVDRHEISGRDGGDITLQIVPSSKKSKEKSLNL